MEAATRAALDGLMGVFHAAEPTPPGPDDPTDEPGDEGARPPAGPAGAAAPLPSIVIAFEAPGSAGASVNHTPNVTLGQLMAAAFLLDCLAREMRAAQLSREARAALVVPGPGGMPPAALGHIHRPQQ